MLPKFCNVKDEAYAEVSRQKYFRELMAFAIVGGHNDYLSSPVDWKLMPLIDVPDESTSRICSRFCPARLLADDSNCTACTSDVSGGRRKIQGMFAEVSMRSEEIAMTGTNALVPICSAR